MTNPLTEEEIEFPIYLPHELLAAVHQFGGKTFRSLMFGCSDTEGCDRILIDHWRHVEGSTWAKEHPVYEHRDMLRFLCLFATMATMSPSRHWVRGNWLS